MLDPGLECKGLKLLGITIVGLTGASLMLGTILGVTQRHQKFCDLSTSAMFYMVAPFVGT